MNFYNKLFNKMNFNEKVSYINKYLNGIVPFGFSGVVLIAKKDEVYVHEGYGYKNLERKLKMEAETVLSTGSISKQYTSTCIMKLVEKENCSIDDSLEIFFSDVPDDKKKITIHHLLTHTSGLISDVGDDFDSISKDEFLSKVFESQLNFNPGEQYSYSNCGYSLLAIIIEKITGGTFQDFLSNEFFEPLEITNTGWFADPKWNDTNSVTYYKDGENMGNLSSWEGSGNSNKTFWNILGNGGVCTSTFQLFTWVRALMKGKLVNKSLLEKMFSPNLENYGYGWNIEKTPIGTLITHNGGSDLGVNSVLKYYADHEITVILMSNMMDNGVGHAFSAESVIDKILYDFPIKFPPVVENISKSDLECISEYLNRPHKINNDLLFNLSKDNSGKLIFQPVGQEILNELFVFDEKTRAIYQNCNLKVEKLGNFLINRDWENAFKLFKDKNVTQSRVRFLEMLFGEFNKHYGELKSISVSGTLPMQDHYCSSHLMFHGEKGKTGMPIVFHDEHEILGFRPIFSDYPLSIPLINLSEKKFLGYHLEYGISLNMELKEENIVLNINEKEFSVKKK